MNRLFNRRLMSFLGGIFSAFAAALCSRYFPFLLFFTFGAALVFFFFAVRF